MPLKKLHFKEKAKLVVELTIAIKELVFENEEKENRATELLIANENLKMSAKELALSNGELEQFVFVASHDLQEPLRMITVFLSLLEKKYNHIIDDKGR